MPLKIYQLRNQRERRALRGGSPYFTYTPGIIAAGATTAINVYTTYTAARKYLPLDYIEIINNEAANPITVAINASPAASNRTITVPARTQRISDEDVQIWTVHVQNDGAVATTAGNIVIKLKRAPLTADSAARRTL